MTVRLATGLALALLIAALPSGRAAAAALSGTIVDVQNGAPLVGANVTILQSNAATVTDARGHFYLPAVRTGDLNLTCSHVGYGSIKVHVPAATGTRSGLQISMEPQLLPIAGVMVTARGRHTALAALAGAAAVLFGADLTASNSGSVASSASTLPGVSLGTDMPWSARAHVRGLSRDHVAFLVNGNRVSTTTELAAQYGTVVPADVERLEVLKGPVSVLYGTGSTGGVVNAIPRSGRFAALSRWSGGTNIGYESAAEGLSSYAWASLGTPRYYLMLSQSYRTYDSYEDGTGGKIPNSQFEDYQSHVNAGIRLSETEVVDLRYQWFEAQDVGVPGAGGVFPDAATVTYPSTRRWLAELTWKHQSTGSAWRSSELRLFLQSVARRAEVQPNVVNYLPATATTPLRRISPLLIEPAADHDGSGFRWSNVASLAGHELVFGLEGWQKELSSLRRRVTEIAVLDADSVAASTVTTVKEDRSLPNSTFRPLGAYLEDEFRPASNLRLNAGVRLDVIRVDSDQTFVSYRPSTDEVLWEASEDTDLALSAQFRSTWSLTERLDLYVNVARSFRSPGIEERFLYVDLGSLVRLGDPQLDSENGYFAESGISHRTDHLLWSAQIYYNRIENLVIETPAEFEGRPALRKCNAGVALLRGFEAQFACTPRGNVLLSADIAYVRGTDQRDHADLPSMPPLNGHLQARYGNRLWCQAEIELVARQQDVAPGEEQTPGHTLLELSCGRSALHLAGAQHRIALGIRNILNEVYRDHLATSRGFPLNAPGRSLYLTWATEL
jgi:hemoglobin/transferrin/lactoferrin receptor protein